ncbi:hypothetical protein BIZ37_03485 [Photobacterium sp. BZF1]|uniref:hypothetical protein n=1 Tax=Photobacterium sp. BZF1 TaxID=1904457 RepID=UPI001653A558|nr:hypothetical protein [Photobacterium sp. BZF1]MBC7001611.1 hypothetical protein [Photobacterium sp. BZF1]
MKLAGISKRKNQVNPTAPNKIKQPGKVEPIQPQTAVMRQQIIRMNLQERPNLIAEVSDSHRMYSRLSLAGEVLRKLASELINLRTIAGLSQYSPEQANRIDQIKKNLAVWGNKQLFGNYVVDSSFAPVQSDDPIIEFTVPGLDFSREQYRDEVVSLYINNRLVALAFDRTVEKDILLEQFKMMFAYAHLRLRVNSRQEFVIGIKDSQWRNWDGQVYVSGQGGRYAEGTPIAVNVTPLHPVFEHITRLAVNEAGASDQIDQALERVNKMFVALSRVLKSKKVHAGQLIAFCHHPELEQFGSFKRHLIESPEVSLKSIQRGFQGPTRDNVINLLAKR